MMAKRRYVRGTVAERFSHYAPTSGDGCWEWTGYLSHGYGALRSTTGSPLLAHRLAYEFAKGPIPEGMQVCHTCDNPKCVRPDHLWVGTFADNIRDAHAKGRTFSLYRGRTHCINCHEWSAGNTRVTGRGHRACRRCESERMVRARKANSAARVAAGRFVTAERFGG